MDSELPRTRAIHRRPPRASRACETCRVRKTKVCTYLDPPQEKHNLENMETDCSSVTKLNRAPTALVCLPENHLNNGARIEPEMYCLCLFRRPLSRLCLQNWRKSEHSDTGKET